MVSELDSFLQFIIAICFTITLDASVFQRFWNADYYGIIDFCITKYKLRTSTPKDDDLMSFIRRHKRDIETKGRMQGTFLLLVSCMLIIYGLFEVFFIQERFIVALNLVITIILLSSFIISVWPNYLTTWGRVLINWGIIILSLVILICSVCYFEVQLNSYLTILASRIILRISLIISIGIPIGYRFLYNWLYTTRYPLFLENLLYKEKEEYDRATHAIREKDDKSLPEKYEKAFRSAYMDTQKNASKEEDVVLICTDIYYEQIQKIIINQPSSFRLFKPLPRIHDEKIKEKTKPIPHVEKVGIEKMQKYNEEYEKMNPRPKINDFCVKNNINVVDFRQYRKQK